MEYTKEDFKEELETRTRIKNEGNLNSHGTGKLKAMEKYKKLILFGVNRSTMTSEEIVSVLCTKTEDERLEIISEFCKSCGSEGSSCQCWNDE